MTLWANCHVQRTTALKKNYKIILFLGQISRPLASQFLPSSLFGFFISTSHGQRHFPSSLFLHLSSPTGRHRSSRSQKPSARSRTKTKSLGGEVERRFRIRPPILSSSSSAAIASLFRSLPLFVAKAKLSAIEFGASFSRESLRRVHVTYCFFLSCFSFPAFYLVDGKTSIQLSSLSLIRYHDGQILRPDLGQHRAWLSFLPSYERLPKPITFSYWKSHT